MPDDTVLLFVYGTLMPGGYYYPRIADHVRQSEMAWCEGALIDVGWYPALVEGGGLVRGVLLHLAPRGLAVTDYVECYTPGAADNEYVRRETDVWIGNDEVLPGDAALRAWTYFFAEPARLIDRPRLVRGARAGRSVHAWTAAAAPDPGRLPD